ncbi:hypothetical protein LAZ67_17001080 [Cordylochernes scorpioides]|uniref:DUF7041 domain-containing protein n=1 Tax=Cordylochernes scorpioides TaxID=51811 RepID=A0ABY6LDD9_9ARAC|nr:hypothetical protein LAZ67_17001080 [Cordylochernes scorpioides]
MESDPDSESGGSTTFPKKENTLGRTEEIATGQEDVTPPPPVSDVLGSLARTIYQLSSATELSRDVELPRYDGSYEAQSFFDNYDAQADLAQLHYTERLRRLPNLLQDDQNNAQPFLRTVTEVQCSATMVSATQLLCQSTPFILQVSSVDMTISAKSDDNGLPIATFVPSPNQREILSYGLKYRPPTRADIPRIIAGVEPAISPLPHATQYTIRQYVTQVLRKPAPQLNLSLDIPLWLNQLEAAFNFANIASDDDFKYNTIIVNLDELALICVFDIVENPPVSGKYAALKERLLLRFGRSRQVRTTQVSETKPIADQRPSIILVELSKPPPSQHCDPCTPTSNSLQHLEQTAFPRDMNVTTTAPVTTVHNVEDTNSSANFPSLSSSLSDSSSLDSSSFCSNPPSNTISCPPETVFSTPVHSDNPLPQQPPSHEEDLPPSCEQKHPLFLEETNNVAATTPLHLQPAQTSVTQPLQPQNSLQQSSPPIEARVTTSLIPIAPRYSRRLSLSLSNPSCPCNLTRWSPPITSRQHLKRTGASLKPPRPDPNPTRHPTKSSLYDYIGSLKILLEGE